MKKIHLQSVVCLILIIVVTGLVKAQLIHLNLKLEAANYTRENPPYVPPTLWYLDADNDGYYIDVVSSVNSPGTNYRSSGIALGDCDDIDASVHESQAWYLDADNDGHYLSVQIACKSPGKGWKNQLTNYYNPEYNFGDCDDTDSTVYEAQKWVLDADNDGFYTDIQTSCKSPGKGWHLAVNSYYDPGNYGDCNDNDSLINRSHLWFLDRDNDFCYTSITQSCNNPGAGWHSCFEQGPYSGSQGGVRIYLNDQASRYEDCDDNDPSIGHPVSWYLDHDNDGYASSITLSCLPPGSDWKLGGLVANDCNDFDKNITVCSTNQPGCPYATTIWILDADSDLHYTDIKLSCNNPGPGWYDPGINLGDAHRGDCNDNDKDVYQIAYWYKDADNDGYYSGTPQLSCSSPGVGWKTAQDINGMLDCDDNDASVNTERIWYLDADNDGYYTSSIKSCKSPGTGWTLYTTLLYGDCNDNDPSVHERFWYKDMDGDGYYTSIAKTCTSPGVGWKTTGNTFGDVNDADSLVWKLATLFIDADGDGYHSGVTTINIGNSVPTGYSTFTYGYDCNDHDANKNPGTIAFGTVYESGCGKVVHNGITYTNNTSFDETLNDVGGCDSAYNTVNITINPLPIINAISSNSPINVGDTIKLQTAASALLSYSWSGPNGFTSFDASPFIVNADSTNLGTYYVTYSDGICSKTDSVQVALKIKKAIIEGRLISAGNKPISNATINLTGGLNASTKSISGVFSFNSLSTGNYKVSVQKNNDIKKANGVSTIDITFIQSHILKKSLLNSPYKLIAADANNDKKISSIDITFIKRLILGLDTTFIGNRLWAFVDSAYKFTDATNPFPYKDSISFTDLKANQANQSFIGVKLGDVNYDWNPAILGQQAANNQPVELYYDTVYNNNASEIKLHIKVNNFKELIGMQFGLGFDKNIYDFVGVENNRLGIDFGTTHSKDGQLTFLWNEPKNEAKTLANGSELFTVVLNKKGYSTSATDLSLNGDITAIEAYDKDLQFHNIIKVSGAILEKVSQVVLPIVESVHVAPNPSNGKAIVTINAKEQKRVHLNLISNSGEIVFSKDVTLIEGKNVLPLSLNIAAGDYYLVFGGLEQPLKYKVLIVK